VDLKRSAFLFGFVILAIAVLFFLGLALVSGQGPEEHLEIRKVRPR